MFTHPPLSKEKKEELIKKNILDPMTHVRRYCSLGHKLRNKYNIPVSYPLYEAQLNTLEKGTLLKDEYQLIADELNIESVEPIETKFSAYAEVVTIEEDGYRFSLDITRDHYLDRKYEERKNKREEAQARKAAGLSYNE